MMSPFPVAAAPPTELSAYAPAPAIGESPTRLQKRTCDDDIRVKNHSDFQQSKILTFLQITDKIFLIKHKQ